MFVYPSRYSVLVVGRAMPFFKELRQRSRASFRTTNSGDSAPQGAVASSNQSTMSAQSTPSPVRSTASSSNLTNVFTNGTTTPQSQPSLHLAAIASPKSNSSNNMTVSWPPRMSYIRKLLTIRNRMVRPRSTDIRDCHNRQLLICLALSQSPRIHG